MEFRKYWSVKGDSALIHYLASGVISFKNPRSFGAVGKLIRGWHVEKMRGTIEQACAYCSKEETRDTDAPFGFVEEGTRPLSAGSGGGRSDLKEVAARVQAGAGLAAIAADHPVSVILFSKGIQCLIGLQVKSRSHLTEVYWYYGPTGSGKTRAASDACPSGYWKSVGSRWWDGYEGHEDVIIDDYRTNFCAFNELLRLFDRYPMQVEIKGGTREFVAKRLFITTPKNPRDTWSLRSDEDLGQLVRRITEVRHFPAMFAPVVAEPVVA